MDTSLVFVSVSVFVLVVFALVLVGVGLKQGSNEPRLRLVEAPADSYYERSIDSSGAGLRLIRLLLLNARKLPDRRKEIYSGTMVGVLELLFECYPPDVRARFPAFVKAMWTDLECSRSRNISSEEYEELLRTSAEAERQLEVYLTDLT